MKLSEILEGSVSQFPTKDRKRSVQMDRLRKKSSYYDELTGHKTSAHPDEQPQEFWIVSQDGKAVATFPTEKEARKMQPELEMKYKVRNTEIVPYPPK